MSTPLHFVILAAGKGTRMKSELPKVLHAVGGEPMIVRILRTASHFQPVTSTVVVGHMADKVRAALARVPGRRDGRPGAAARHRPRPASRPSRRWPARPARSSCSTATCRCSRPSRSRGLLAHHQATGAAATVLTAHLPNPAGLGRIVRENGRFARIVEERDASPAEKAHHRVQQRHLRLRAGRALRRAGPDRHRERPGRVLPHRPARHLPGRRPARRDLHHRRCRRAARRQQPRRARRS